MHRDYWCRHLCGMFIIQAGAGMEAGQMSDATASGPASDDEAGSMAAADGSMQQASPVEHGGSGAGSDSGGSQVESVSGMFMFFT
jgi:E3 ubiquitin-protein ligase UBR4